MLKINWGEPISYYHDHPEFGSADDDCVTQIKTYLAVNSPDALILVENRGVYVLDLTDIKMYHSSKSLKPLWRIGDGFSKTLIATIEEVDENEKETG